MEFKRRSYSCRLCLCCDDSFACIFEEKAFDQYNIASLLGELLQLKVAENDGYPKYICLSCRKTVTDFKKFKQNCLKAMITYDMEIRIPEIGNINQRLKGDEIDNTTITMGFLKQETNADDLDAFGNPLTKDECSLSDNELLSSISGVDCDEIVHEPGFPKDSGREVIIPAVVKKEDDLDQDYHENASLTASSHDDIDEYCNSIKRKTSVQDCHKCTMCGMEFHLLSLPDLHLKSHEINPPKLEIPEITVDHVKEETFMPSEALSTDFVVNNETNPVEQSLENIKPFKCLECSKEFSRKCDYTRHSRVHKPVTSLLSEQNPESRCTRSTDLKQKEVNRLTLEVNLLQDKRKRRLDLESKSLESKGTISVELFRTVSSSKMDKSNEDEIEQIQQRDSVIASEFQSGSMTTKEECHSFEEEEDVSLELRNSAVKKGKDEEGDGMSSHYNCDHCSKFFNDIHSLNMHLSLHERDVSIEGKEVTSMNTSVNKNANKNIGKISHNCGVCGKSFKKKFTLKVHMRSHSGKKPFECGVCHQMFNHKCHRDRHVVSIHESYRCSYCSKSFPVKDKLAEHVQECRIKRVFHCNWCNKCFDNHLSRNEHLSTHRTAEVFKCHYCSQCFPSKCSLFRHKRIHTGERSFICSVCGKSFRHQSNFIVHMRIHTNDKRYKCGYCDKSFIQGCDLKRHEWTHTKEKPYRCSYCNKSFVRKNYVKVHEQIHRGGEKDFGCSICGMRFLWRGNLKRHERIHLKIKPFGCDICKRYFCRKSNLRKHIKIHMKQNQ